jgi:hypothetical protein
MTAYRAFDGDAWLGRDLPLADGVYQVQPETAFAVAQEMAFARQGRKAQVYKLRGPDGAIYALKTFYRGFSLPEYAAITAALSRYGDLRGLRTCRRRVVTDAEATAVGEPGLANAVLMPWIDGVPWAGVVEGRFPLAEATCLDIATQTATVLAALEEQGLAHADISSTNVVIANAEAGSAIELIDVEDMYHESFVELPYVPDGSPGYAHPRNQGKGCRNPYGDRFAGAVLLTEMLVWPDPEVRASSSDVSVFAVAEVGHGGAKYATVRRILADRSAELARLFERAWDSPGPSGCPRLAEWAEVIATIDVAAAGSNTPQSTVEGSPVACPGCGESPLPGLAVVHHKASCPLHGPAVSPEKSSFPGVPTHQDIGFVPIFGA